MKSDHQETPESSPIAVGSAVAPSASPTQDAAATLSVSGPATLPPTLTLAGAMKLPEPAPPSLTPGSPLVEPAPLTPTMSAPVSASVSRQSPPTPPATEPTSRSVLVSADSEAQQPNALIPAASEDPSVSGKMLPATPTAISGLALASSEDDSESEIDSDARPSPVAEFVSRLQQEDVNVVQEALDRFKEACRRGDQSFIEQALVEQATLLNALGLKLVDNAGGGHGISHIQLWANLGLRALEMARKSLETLILARGRPSRQTNVQVNVGAPTNELKVVPRE